MNLVTRAALRVFCLAPVNLPSQDTIAGADLRTSICDARVALTLAMGERPDVDGYPIVGTTCPSCGVICGHRTTCGITPAPLARIAPETGELVLFEVAS